MTVLRPVEPAAPQVRGDPPPHRAGRSLMALLAGILALPPLLMAGAAWHGWQQTWRDAEQEMLHGAEGAAEYLRRVLDGHDLRIQRANDLIAGLSDAEIRADEARLHRAFIRIAGREADGSGPLTLSAFDREARLLVGATLFPVPRDLDFSDRDFNQALRDPAVPEPHVSRVHIGRIDGRPFFAVSRRRRESGNPPVPGGYDGIVEVSVYTDNASAALHRLLPGPEDVLSLVRTDGEVLARSAGFGPGGPPLRIAADSPLLAFMAQGGERTVSTTRSTLDGVHRLAVYQRVEGWPVYAVAARPESAIRRRWWEHATGALAVGLPAWMLLLGMAGAVWRRQRALAEANATLEQRVAARTQDLAESEARLRLAQEAAGIGIWEWNPETGLSRWSPEQYALFGLDPEREPTISVGRFLGLVHPEDRATVKAATREALRRGAYEAEFRILRPRPDGPPELRWMLGRGRRLMGRGGAGNRLIGVNVDITDRRAAEERRALVAQEVAHRAKNALQLVGAAVRMTRATDTAEFIRLVEGRVAALARAQFLLAEAGGRGADLRALAEGEVATVLAGEEHGPRVSYDGPALSLAEGAVQPVSMALHELATNAAKYGALSVPDGMVALSWAVDRAAGLLRLRWVERGGPPPSGAPEREGFGTRVLEATLTNQLGGRIRRDWPASGLVLEAELPLARVAAAT
ncbi:HWE histidine kinase domain-containing protein [Roseicella aerolata]|uniref:histidine kinase n=1 Tax=Roseicella aerolata TaxID=2883479 RepID=A0A9X1L789_9PROT|nr:HWE histidine kinase domain-containing protein [Roseicella aerolata]MCB4821274.1 PAS domain-containing protein [Roseicella aerolata]